MGAVMKTYQIDEKAHADLVSRFTYHPPKDGQADKYHVIRENALEIAKGLVTACPPSRELSLALTKLEEAVFWANAAIARHE